jgi:hypothetical protein
MVKFYIGRGAAWLALLATLSLAFAWRRRDRDEAARLVALWLSAVVAFGIAAGELGPVWWFAPYSWLSAIVPGFSTIRIPLRFGLLLSFCTAMLAGLGVASALVLLERSVTAAAARRVAIALVAGVALAAALVPLALRRPPRLVAVPTGADVPAVYRWLAEHGEGAPLLELPVLGTTVTGMSKAGRAETMAMYFSTYHWLPILNGYSGYIPGSYAALMEQAMKLPDPEALRLLVDCAGLRWILLRAAAPATAAAWRQTAGLKSRGSFARAGGADDLLYEVESRPRSACPLAAVAP